MSRVSLDLQVGDVLRLKKEHPCGSSEWVVFRIGADIGIECRGCKRRILSPRFKLTPRVKEVRRGA